MRVGIIGLGKMGGGMAARLADAGFSLTVHEVRRQAAAAVIDTGARWADSPREAAEASDLVATSLHGPTEAEDVYLGERGDPAGLRAGAETCGVVLEFTE